jgi:4-amino-4-deoxy-L-arabinose transferase-like glycosyltransferase
MVFDFPERLNSPSRLLPYALLLSIAFALYGPSLYYEFVWDDFFYVNTNYRIHGLTEPQMKAVWTATYLGHYAPVHHTFLALLYQVSGADPFGYHLAQVLLHVVCVFLLFLVLARIESPRIALFASLLYSVHPTAVETVAWVSETKSTLAFLFFLLSFLAFLRLREKGGWGAGILCAVFLALSLLAKINTVVAPAIFLLWDYRQRRAFDRKTVASLACFFLISVLMAAVHMASFMGTEWTGESGYYGGLGVHVMNLPLFIFFYLQMTLVPHPLSAWYIFPVAPEFTWTLAALWAALLILSGFLLRSSRRIQFWALWFLVFLAPVLQIIPFGIWVADRYLYIPIIGLFVLAGSFFFHLLDRFGHDRSGRLWRRWAWEAALCIVLLTLAWRTTARLPVWKDNLTLWETTYPTCPNSAYCNESLGLALMRAGQLQRGGDLLVQAVALRPAPTYLVNLADALTWSARNYPEAARIYLRALQDPAANSGTRLWVTDAYAGLARAFILQGNLQEAAHAVNKGKNLNAGNPRLWVVEGFLHWKRGDLDAARRSLGTALTITGQRSRYAPFFTYYWGDHADVGRLLGDLRAAREAAESNPQETSR